MTEAVQYGLPLAAAALICLAEGMLLLGALFGGLALRAAWSRLTRKNSVEVSNANG